MSLGSKLTNDQISWLKDVIHPDFHSNATNESFLNDSLYHTVKTLVDMGKDYKDLPICYQSGAGMGFGWFARRLNDKSKIDVMFSCNNDEINKFWDGYLNLNRRRGSYNKPGYNPYPLI